MKSRFAFRKQKKIEATSQHNKPYLGLAQQIIGYSDIILEILDARFIQDTRNFEIENLVKTNNKKIIYVLNKSDLIDVNKTKKEIELHNLYPYVFVSCKLRKGSKQLRDRIKILAKNIDTTYKRVQVGVVGYPNTGKSSVINMLVGRDCAKTAFEAGFTKGIQMIRLTENIVILDTPGIVPATEAVVEKTDLAKHVRIGARNFDKVHDPEIIVQKLMEKYPDIFEKFYGIEAQGDSDILIEELGKKKKLLKKGGLVDVDRTARFILRDWQRGFIKV